MSEPQNSTPPIISNGIAQDIKRYYDRLNEKKEFQKLVREVVEEQLLHKTIQDELPVDFEEYQIAVNEGSLTPEEQEEVYTELLNRAKVLINTTYLIDGMALVYKKRTQWSWKDSINEELEDIGCLHLGKKITSYEENRYDISAFELTPDKSLRVTNKLKLTKEQKEKKKAKTAAIRKRDKQLLMKKTLEELVLLYRQNKSEVDNLERTYKDDRRQLLKSMVEEKIEVAIGDDEGLFSLQLTDKNSQYKVEEIITSSIKKGFFFLFTLTNDGEVYCEDAYTKQTFTFVKETEFDGHIISFTDDKLFVDGEPLNIATPSDIGTLKKKDIKYIEENELTLAIGTATVSGVDFFKACPVSSTQIEKLIDEGRLNPSVLKEYRTIKSVTDITTHFEMVEDETKALRSSIFRHKHNLRSQHIQRNIELQRELQKTMNI